MLPHPVRLRGRRPPAPAGDPLSLRFWRCEAADPRENASRPPPPPPPIPPLLAILLQDVRLAGTKVCDGRGRMNRAARHVAIARSAAPKRALERHGQLRLGSNKKRRADDHPDANARVQLVKRQRLGHTYVSASWRDGVMGPGFVALSQTEAYSPEGLEAMRFADEKYAGRIKVVPSGRSTHFFDGRLIMSYMRGCALCRWLPRLIHLGDSWVPLRNFVGSLGGLLGSCWAVLGPSLPIMGPSWAVGYPGNLWGPILGLSSAMLGPSWGVLTSS